MGRLRRHVISLLPVGLLATTHAQPTHRPTPPLDSAPTRNTNVTRRHSSGDATHRDAPPFYDASPPSRDGGAAASPLDLDGAPKNPTLTPHGALLAAPLADPTPPPPSHHRPHHPPTHHRPHHPPPSPSPPSPPPPPPPSPAPSPTPSPKPSPTPSPAPAPSPAPTPSPSPTNSSGFYRGFFSGALCASFAAYLLLVHSPTRSYCSRVARALRRTRRGGYYGFSSSDDETTALRDPKPVQMELAPPSISYNAGGELPGFASESSLSPAEFERRWSSGAAGSRVLSAAIPAPASARISLDEAESILTAEGLTCIAAGAVGGVHKAYFAAQLRDGSGDALMVELVLLWEARRVQLTCRGDTSRWVARFAERCSGVLASAMGLSFGLAAV